MRFVRVRSDLRTLIVISSGQTMVCTLKKLRSEIIKTALAVLAFDPRVDSAKAGPFITQSPYVQNCTSLTSSGIGLRIDGSKVSGLRSMVLDAFTQFNAGGTGVHLLNRGYAQLVSLFTVSTTTSVLRNFWWSVFINEL